MKIWITGGNGFTGKNLTEYLKSVEKNTEIVCTGRKEVNLYDKQSVADFYRKGNFDYVINCAISNARLSGAKGETGSELHNNVTMFLNLAEELPGSVKMINFGSGAQYDKRRPLVKITEDRLGEAIPADDYGLSKFIAARYTERSPQVLTLNIFGLYGKYENYRQKFISNAIAKKLIGMPIVINQDVKFDYLYIDDFCKIVYHYLKHFQGGQCINISPKDSILLSQIAGIIDIKLGGEGYTVKNTGLNKEYTGDCSKLLQDIPNLGFTPYKTGIENLIHYYLDIKDELDTISLIDDSYLQRVIKIKEEAAKAQ